MHSFIFLILAVMAKSVAAGYPSPPVVTVVNPSVLAESAVFQPAGIGALLTQDRLKTTCIPSSGSYSALSKPDFYQLLGQSMSDCLAVAQLAKQTLRSRGCELVTRKIIPARKVKKVLKRFSRKVNQDSYEIIAIFIPSRVVDENEKIHEVASLVKKSFWSSFFTNSQAETALEPSKLESIKFKSCTFKNHVINQCVETPGCVDVLAQQGFQINVGGVEGECLTSETYVEWGVAVGTYKCVPRAYGDVSIVLKKGNKIRVETYKNAIAIGNKCV
ncbi:hypothetical protein N9V90_01335 [Endozoicomonas sp.]|nr:hypothetical protein [Endozoicomonas sp.]